MIVRPVSLLCLSGLILIAGCGSERDVSEDQLREMAGGTLKDTSAVSGKVTIDGEPTFGVNIYAFTEGGVRPEYECRTNVDGSYCWTTHAQCDGLPPGEYKLAFAHIPKERRGADDLGEDQLQGKYMNPMESGFTLTVASGTPQENVDYALTSE